MARNVINLENVVGYAKYGDDYTNIIEEQRKKKKKQQEKEDSWTDFSAFEDGYQLGDVTKAILGTGVKTGQNFTKGLQSNLEGLLDFGTNVASMGTEALGLNNATEKLRNFAQKDFIAENDLVNKTLINTNPMLALLNQGLGAYDNLKDGYDPGDLLVKNNQIATLFKGQGTLSKSLDKIASNSITGNKLDSLAQTVGQISGQAALGSTGIPWQLTAFANSAGGEMNNAFQNNATAGQAFISGLISGAVEVGTEYIGSGANKLLGMESLGSKALGKLGSKISNKVVNRLLKIGIDASSEGLEEVLSGLGTAIGQKLTYMNDKELEELYSKDQALDDFIMGALGTVITNVPGQVQSVKRGENAFSGLTENEQTILDKVIEERTNEAQKDGKELSKKELREIEDQAREDLQNGYISADTIEETLGDNYNADKDVMLRESFNERARRRTNFNTDLNQYKDENQRKIVQKAIDSGILNDSKKTHNFVDLVSKIAADKGMDFDFTNNERIKESGFGVEGKTVNGYVNGNTIGLNIESNNALNKTVGHEITHVLEGSDMYQALQDTLRSYVGEGEWQSRLKSLSETYKNVENADVTKELTADLVGENLFNNENFVRSLSTKDRNLFEKIYDEIKYLVKVATAGSKEKRDLVKLQKVFQEAYRDSKTTREGTQYSLISTKGAENAVKNDSRNQFLLDNLDKAKEMQKEGKSNEEIRKESKGWFQDPRGNWWYEIPDNEVELKKMSTELEPNSRYTLGELINCEDLFEIYEGLEDLPVFTTSNPDVENAAYEDGIDSNNEIGIYINNNKLNSSYTYEQLRTDLIHEIQHRIQDLEGIDYKGATSSKNGIITSESMMNYLSNLGEISATDAEDRSRKSAEWLKNNIPEIGKETPVHKYIKDLHKQMTGSKQQQANAQKTFDTFPGVEQLYDMIYNGDGVEYNEIIRNNKKINSTQEKKTFKKILDDVGKWLESRSGQTTESSQNKEVDNTSFSNDVRYSLSDNDIQTKINQSMTMDEAREMLQRAFVLSDIQDYSDGAVNNIDEWVNNDDWNYQISMIIDSNQDLYNKYIASNEGINNDEYTLDDVIEAYKNGTLTGKVRQDYGRVDTSINTNYIDDNFYSPQQIEATNELYEKANQRVTKSNKDEVYKARADFIIAAHNQNVSEQLGIDAKELNSKLKSWANYPSKTLELSKQLNENVSNQNKWSGLENSSIVNDISITDEQLESMVKQVIGKENSNGWKRKYITSAMLALDTHIDYKNLTFDFEQSSKLQEQHAAGDYNNRTNVIRIGSGYQNTVAHEMGHYIDYQWARELFGNENRPLSSISRNYNQEKLTQDQIKFIEHFREFQNNIETKAEMGDTLKYGSSKDASYWQEPTETFARFVGKFTEWVKNQATNNRYGYEEKHYTDRFTENQYKEFVKILQEKSALDTTMEKRYGTYNQDSIAIMDSITPEQRAELKQAFDELDNEQTPSYQLTERIQDIIGKDNYYKLSNEQLKSIANDTQFSLSQQNDIAPTRGWDVRGRDIALESAIAPLQEQVQQLQSTLDEVKNNIAPLEDNLPAISEQEASQLESQFNENDIAPIRDNLTKQESQRLDFLDRLERENMLTDNLAEERNELIAKEENAPEYGEDMTPIESLNDVRDMDEVARDRSANAYQYEHPEVKPYFQEEARILLAEINEVMPGERFMIEGRDANHPTEWKGYKRQASEDVANLLDGYTLGTKYTKDQLREGLNAIIEDHGLENKAVSKRLEFMLDDRLRNGYKTIEGYQIEPNADYLNMLKEQSWDKYYDEAPIEEAPNDIRYSAEDEFDLAPFEPQERDVMEMVDNEGYRKSTTQNRPPIPYKQKGGLRQAVDALKSGFINRNVEIDNLSRDSGNRNIKLYGDMMNSAMGEVSYDIGTAQTNNRGETVGKSIKGLFEKAKRKGLGAAFNDFLINYSNIDRYAQNKGSQTPLDVSKRLVRDYAIKYPEFKQWAKDVWTYGKNARQNLVDAGLIDQQLADYLGEIYPHYVPYVSDYENADRYFEGVGELIPKGLKRAKGNAGKLLSVEDALAKYTYAQKMAIRQNDLYKEIVHTLGQTPSFGVDERTDYTDMRNSLYSDSRGNYLTAYENGKQITTQVSKDLFKELSRTTENQLKDVENKLSLITKPLQGVSKLRKSLITTWNPTFPVTNAIKDLQDALFNSKHTKDMVKNYLGAIKELATGKGKQVNQFLALYGSGLTMGEYSSDGLNQLTEKIPLVNTIKQINEVVELAPRYAEFKASLQNGESLQEAIYNAREVTTNFNRGGTIAKAMNRNGFTFLNASIQGFDKFIRNFSGENGAKGIVQAMAKVAALGIAPALFNHLAYDDDEEYEGLKDYIKDNYYLIKNEKGSLMYNLVGEFTRIPKGRMLSIFGSAARRALESASGEEDAFEGYLGNAWNQIGINDPGENNVFAPFIQAFGSKNGTAWYGGDIVPSRLQKENTENQYDENTDKFSIWLGDKIGVSPKKINYVLDQYLGGIGDVLLPMGTEAASSDAESVGEYLMAPWKDKFSASSADDSKYPSEFYSTRDSIPSGVSATDEEKLQKKYLDYISYQMTDLYAKKREVQSDPELSKKEKYRQATEIKEQINELAKQGLEDYKNVDISGDYATVNGIRYKKGKDGKWTKQRK